jgi:hypothetical protein
LLGADVLDRRTISRIVIAPDDPNTVFDKVVPVARRHSTWPNPVDASTQRARCWTMNAGRGNTQ